MKLSDVAELTAGVITGRVLEDKKSCIVNPDNRIQVLVPRAIHDGRLDKTLLAEEYRKDDGRDIPSKFLTEKGDIIIKLSSPYDSCLIGDEDQGDRFCNQPLFSAGVSELEEMRGRSQEQVLRIGYGNREEVGS